MNCDELKNLLNLVSMPSTVAMIVCYSNDLRMFLYCIPLEKSFIEVFSCINIREALRM